MAALERAIWQYADPSDAAPAAFRSWQARALIEDRNATSAEGLATRVPFELPQRILWDQLDDFVYSYRRMAWGLARTAMTASGLYAYDVRPSRW